MTTELAMSYMFRGKEKKNRGNCLCHGESTISWRRMKVQRVWIFWSSLEASWRSTHVVQLSLQRVFLSYEISDEKEGLRSYSKSSHIHHKSNISDLNRLVYDLLWPSVPPCVYQDCRYSLFWGDTLSVCSPGFQRKLLPYLLQTRSLS